MTAATLCVAVVLYAPGGAAADKSLEESLADCAKFDDDSLRLACVDKLIAVLNQAAPAEAEAHSDSLIFSAEVSTNDTSIGPEPEPDISTEQHTAASDTSDTIRYNLVSTYQDRWKRWYFEFDNGEVWRQTEARYLPRIKQYPVPVSISKGVFGSHDLRSEHFSGSIKVTKHK